MCPCIQAGRPVVSVCLAHSFRPVVWGRKSHLPLITHVSFYNILHLHPCTYKSSSSAFRRSFRLFTKTQPPSIYPYSGLLFLHHNSFSILSIHFGFGLLNSLIPLGFHFKLIFIILLDLHRSL